MRKLASLAAITAAAAAVLMIVLLLVRPFVGVADNGDFLRVMGTVGLNYGDPSASYDDQFFKYAHAQFSYDSFFRGAYVSTQIILVLAARVIGAVFHPSAFDVRILGAFYIVLMTAAIYCLVRYGSKLSRWTGIAVALCAFVMLCDIGYLAYFNSFFGEPVSYVFMLLTIGLGLLLTRQERPSRKLLVLFFLSTLFLACSKIQNAPIGGAFAIIGLRFAGLGRDIRWRKLAYGWSAALFLIAVIMYVAAPKDLKHINLYQTVFFGVMNGSPDVEGDLEELGLPPRLSVLAGTNYFQTDTAIKQNDPSLKPDFYDRISHKDILLFYLKHPGRLIDKMEYAAENGMTIRPYYLGNYEKEAGKPPGAVTSVYSVWSEFKLHQLPNKLWFIALVYLLYYAAAAYEYLRRPQVRSRRAVELFMLIGLVGIFSFLIPILGDGQADMAKHLFLFNVCFDMMIVTAIAYAAFYAEKLVRGRRASYN
ncbi:hypothetical protein FHS18_000782 [Paenibacillus phyllosphaerae]|uniref:Transmembrane protein n=1 Tax=Paenibacillus phyllosphaerae TaxID=274593 RepID=A0A7W5AU01_9BACL|nr:hypothetical protein [Paenibacillus phyllosphaerae]MBB3108754.1 hypothetical protein [Paenibacillus phyllosphaerae]